MAPKHEFVTCPTCGTKVSVPDTIQDPMGRPLRWMTGPDRDMNWYQACQWARTLEDTQWRMPTGDELAGLGPKLHPDFKTSGWWIWSGESDGPLSAMGLDVNLGQVYSGGRELDSGGRVFVVR
ncbi:MAG: DUF1566 domain-containing protein [Desulfobacterales bacterium]|nr:DUF1566 domain-containing protein [Desulfobacterales bacterium]